MITKNAQGMIGQSLVSVRNLVHEIIIVDNCSTDNTLEIAKKFGAKIYRYIGHNLGEQRAYGLKKIKTEWVLVVDSDEIISKELMLEIMSKLKTSHLVSNTRDYVRDKQNLKVGYCIPFQNHYFGRKLKYGGENYKKLILFKKSTVKIEPALVHESFKIVKGKVGTLKNKVYHYSYNSLYQMYKKFTDYALREAKQKVKNGEKTSFKKIFFYAPHMFWARFIKDKGYKDGFFRLPLDIGFAYMEFLTYFSMLFYK